MASAVEPDLAHSIEENRFFCLGGVICGCWKECSENTRQQNGKLGLRVEILFNPNAQCGF